MQTLRPLLKGHLAIVSFGLLLIFSSSVWAEDFGMAMSIEGKVMLQRNSESIPLEFGESIYEGDILQLAEKTEMILISYIDCQEWELQGPLEVTVTWELTKKGKGSMKPIKELPVCYSHEEISNDDSGTIGGLVLRGTPKDPVQQLRQEFIDGKASNTTLITLILHDLKEGNKKGSKIYLNALKQRSPNSAFIKKMEELVSGP